VRVEWSYAAGHDLRSIFATISEEDRKAARRVVQGIRSAVAGLMQNPLLGRVGAIENTRELVIPRFPYVVVYRMMKDRVRILAVFHTSRLWQPEFDRA
jgi:toxin ParE1/3/4